MSHGPWKINERSFLHQISFIYYTCFVLKADTPQVSGPRAGEIGCWEREGLARRAQQGVGEGRG